MSRPTAAPTIEYELSFVIALSLAENKRDTWQGLGGRGPPSSYWSISPRRRKAVATVLRALGLGAHFMPTSPELMVFRPSDMAPKGGRYPNVQTRIPVHYAESPSDLASWVLMQYAAYKEGTFVVPPALPHPETETWITYDPTKASPPKAR